MLGNAHFFFTKAGSTDSVRLREIPLLSKHHETVLEGIPLGKIEHRNADKQENVISNYSKVSVSYIKSRV